MRHALLSAVRFPVLALALAAGLGGCGYAPVPPDPIRYVTSTADVMTCRRLGAVGFTRTDGTGPYSFSDLTTPLRVGREPGDTAFPIQQGEIFGRNLAVTIEVMRDSALALGATDLLLSRRLYKDWSYATGTAYRCPR